MQIQRKYSLALEKDSMVKSTLENELHQLKSRILDSRHKHFRLHMILTSGPRPNMLDL